MSDNEKEKSNKKLPPALLVVIAVGLVLGGFAFFNSMKQPAFVPEQEISQVEPVVEDSTEIQETEDAGQPATVNVKEVTGTRSVGDINAPIKIIEYASLTCNHCAHFHNDIFPVLKEKYIDTGKVYFEFREFPLNDAALKATITARCLPENKYDAFITLLFKTQDQWSGGVNYMLSLKQNAKLAGLSDAQFEACHASADVKMSIAENMQIAKEKWEINSTPTFIINDGQEKISGSVAVEEFERVFRKVSDDKIGVVSTVK